MTLGLCQEETPLSAPVPQPVCQTSLWLSYSLLIESKHSSIGERKQIREANIYIPGSISWL